MASEIIITNNFKAVAARFGRMAASSTPIVESYLPIMIATIAKYFKPVLEFHTPVGKEFDPHPGKLRESTEYSLAAAGYQAMARFDQPAMSAPNEDGTGGDIPYLGSVLGGRTDVYPVNKKALANRAGFGPTGHAGPVAPNPFNIQALEQFEPVLYDFMGQFGGMMIADIVALGSEFPNNRSGAKGVGYGAGAVPPVGSGMFADMGAPY